MVRGGLPACKSWSVKSDIAKAVDELGIERTALAAAEDRIEKTVSSYLSAVPYLWIDIDDEPGPGSLNACGSVLRLCGHIRSIIGPGKGMPG